MDTQAFIRVSEQLEQPATASQAQQQLIALRSYDGAVHLAKSVLESATSVQALFQACVLLRDAVLRAWPSIPYEQRTQVRDWTLSQVANNRSSIAEPVLRQYITCTACLWKRGWLEEDTASKTRLFEHITALFRGDTAAQSIGAKLCLTLIEEFSCVDSSAGGGGTGSGVATASKSTALGLPTTFHKQAAAAFTEYGLREATHAVCTCLLQQLQACLGPGRPGTSALPIDLCTVLLDTLVAALSWDSRAAGGSGAGNGQGRLSPGKRWSDLLADPSHTLLHALFGLYTSMRLEYACGGRAVRLASPCRQLLRAMCTLTGEVFPSPDREVSHAQAAVGGLLSLLSSPLHDQAAALSAASSQGGTGRVVTEQDVCEAGDEEASDLTQALASAIRTYRLAGIAGWRAGAAGSSSALTDVSPLFIATATLGAKVLQPFHTACSRLNESLAATRAPGQKPSHEQRAALKAARAMVEHVTSTRFASAMATLDGVLEAWCAGLSDMEQGAGLPGMGMASSSSSSSGTPSSSAHGEQAWLDAVRRGIVGPAYGLYERLVSTRLVMGAAVMRCDIDDDAPFEDPSALADHMALVAQVGRAACGGAGAPGPTGSSVALLADMVQGTLQQLHALAVAGGHAHAAGDLPTMLPAPVMTPPGHAQRSGGSPNSSSTGGTPINAVGHVAGDPDTEMSVVSESLWWLVGYAGYLLCDEAAGEEPTIPSALNSLSKRVAKEVGQAAAVQADPVVRLSAAVLSCVQFDFARLCADPSLGAGLSPLLTRQLAWFCGRWGRTYLMPFVPEGAHAGESLSTTLTAAYGADAGVYASAAMSGALGGTRLLHTVPTTPGVMGGRQALELALQHMCTSLAVWGGLHAEPELAAVCLSSLRSLSHKAAIARYLVISPSVDAVGHTVGCVLAMPEEATAAAGKLGKPGTAGWASLLPCIVMLSPNSQSSLLCMLLSLCPHVAFGLPGYETARGLTLEGEEAGAAGPWADISTGQLTQAFVQAHGHAVCEVVQRWLSYYSAFLSALRARYSAVAAGLSSMAQAGQVPTDPRLEVELERMLALHTGVLKAASCMPEDWHLPAMLSLLSTCPALVALYRGHGPVVPRVLHFILAVMDSDWSSAAQNEAIYGAITAVFEQFSKNNNGSAVAHSSSGSRVAPKARGQSTMGRVEQEDEEEEKHADILLLLAILERIGDKEMTDFSSHTAAPGSGDVSSPASRAMLVGLAYLLPLVTGTLLQYPRTASAYMGVVAAILGRQPSMAARLSPHLFHTLVTSLDYGLAHPEPEVVKTSLEAVRGMAVYHTGAKRKGGGYAALDLSPQLASMPDLFSRFLRPCLSLVLAGPAPHPSLLGPTADTILALVQADAQGYQAAVQALLATQANAELAARVGQEFNLLTSANGLQLGHTLPGSAPPIVVRKAKDTFRGNFEEFVVKVRGLTTIL